MTTDLKAKRRPHVQGQVLERDKQICFVLMRLYQALQNSGDGAPSAEIVELEAKLKKLHGQGPSRSKCGRG